MKFFSLTSPWYDHTRKRQFLFISLYPLSFDEGRTSGAGVRPLSSSAQAAGGVPETFREVPNERRVGQGADPYYASPGPQHRPPDFGGDPICDANAKVFQEDCTDGGPAGQAGTAQRLSGPAG